MGVVAACVLDVWETFGQCHSWVGCAILFAASSTADLTLASSCVLLLPCRHGQHDRAAALAGQDAAAGHTAAIWRAECRG